MKTLDLNNYGVEEMAVNEVQEVNGGILQLIVMAVVAGLVAEIICNPSESAQTVMDGYNYRKGMHSN